MANRPRRGRKQHASNRYVGIVASEFGNCLKMSVVGNAPQRDNGPVLQYAIVSRQVGDESRFM